MLSVLHHLWELAQTHGHCISNAIQPSHPLLSPSPPAFNLSQQDGQLWEGNLSAPCCKAFPPPLLPASTADLSPTLSVSRHLASSVSLRGLYWARTGHELGMFPHALQRWRYKVLALDFTVHRGLLPYDYWFVCSFSQLQIEEVTVMTQRSSHLLSTKGLTF